MARVKSDAALEELKTFGLAYPGAHTKSPWPGHNDLAVNDKTFAYLNVPGEPFSIGCKLPASSHVALLFSWVVPTPYGLGKSGWVTATPPADQAVPVEMFKEWIDESYRAQAPKKLVAQIGVASAPAATAKPAPKKSAPKKSAPKKSAPKKSAPKKPAKKKPTKKTAAKKPKPKKK